MVGGGVHGGSLNPQALSHFLSCEDQGGQMDPLSIFIYLRRAYLVSKCRSTHSHPQYFNLNQPHNITMATGYKNIPSVNEKTELYWAIL